MGHPARECTKVKKEQVGMLRAQEKVKIRAKWVFGKTTETKREDIGNGGRSSQRR